MPGTSDTRPGRRWGPWLACEVLFLIFDCATILPLAAELYILKRSVNLDVFKGVDTLPDPLIEGALHWVLRAIGLS